MESIETSDKKANAKGAWPHLTFLLVVMLLAMCFSGEIVYQDYLAESELLSEQDREAKAWILASFDWNYFFESNSLAVALKITYEHETDEGSDLEFLPVVVRYDFHGVHEPVDKSIRRADKRFGKCGQGFCMVGLDSFLFSHGQRQCPKTAFMCISDSTQTVVDITRDVGGRILYGALSASERAVFPSGEGYAFPLYTDIGSADDSCLLLWNKGVVSLWPVPMQLKRYTGYTCLTGGRVLLDVLDTSDIRTRYQLHLSSRTGQDVQVVSNVWMTKSREYWKANARCHRVLSRCDTSAVLNVYADWDVALSNKIISLGKDDIGRYDWSIDLHGMKATSSNNELGHEFVEGQGVLYDFFKWRIFRIRKNDLDWQAFDLKEFFGEDVDHVKDSIPMSVLHRGTASWYYAFLFEYEKQQGCGRQRYRIKIVEVPRKGENAFLWTFPDFYVAKKLTTYPVRSSGVVHKLQDDSWVFISDTCTFMNDEIFVQRMTGSREEINPEWREVSSAVGGWAHTPLE